MVCKFEEQIGAPIGGACGVVTQSADATMVHRTPFFLVSLGAGRAAGNVCRGCAAYPGFCNGPWFVNPSFRIEYPFAGVVLLSGVGAVTAT